MTEIIRPNTNPSEEELGQMKSELLKLIVSMGGLTATSKLLGIKYFTLNSWKTRGRISAVEARRISEYPEVKKKGFTKEKFRPDVKWWGEE